MQMLVYTQLYPSKASYSGFAVVSNTRVRHVMVVWYLWWRYSALYESLSGIEIDSLNFTGAANDR